MSERGEEAPLAELRSMQEVDLPEVRKIDAKSLARPWTCSIWREELRSPFGSYLVAESGRGILGYVGIKYISDELHVMSIAVHPESRRQGLARQLLLAVVSGYPEARTVYLEVRPSNDPARALYESLGFSTVGHRPRYYGDEDALIMSLDL